MSAPIDRIRTQEDLDAYVDAACAEAWSDMAAEIFRLKTENERLRGALTFYASSANWTSEHIFEDVDALPIDASDAADLAALGLISDVEADQGSRARAALEPRT